MSVNKFKPVTGITEETFVPPASTSRPQTPSRRKSERKEETKREDRRDGREDARRDDVRKDGREDARRDDTRRDDVRKDGREDARRDGRDDEKFSGDTGDTLLFSGEKVSKKDKIISAIGSLEELFAYIGVIKAEHFNASSERKFDIPNSMKVFLFARLTQIQETLLDIIMAIGTTRKVVLRYEGSRFSAKDGETRLKELEDHINEMKNYDSTVTWPENGCNPKNSILPGTSVLEAQLLYARTICRRAERQVISCKNNNLGIFPEELVLTFLNRLGDYLFALSVHSLHLHSKEPMKRTGTKK